MLAFTKQKLVGAQLLLCVLTVALAGCKPEGIRVYQVAKEEPTATLSRVPAGWESAPPGEMRVASFRVKGQAGKIADVSVIPLPGQAGRDIDNVNRWRGQVGLPAVSEAELPKLALPVDVAGQAAQLYDIDGKNTGSGEKTRILAAILRKDSTAWFFKMTGDDGLVAQQKTAFVEYLRTFQFPSTTSKTADASQPAELPPNHPPLGATSLTGQPSTGAAQTAQDRPTWTVPPGWREVDGGQFLVAKFVVPGENNSQAAVNVSMSAGDGGGLTGNVNRWRQQLGLNQLTESAVNELVTRIDAGPAKASFVDMTGADPRTGDKARVIAAVIPQGSRTWFYKLMGPIPTVNGEKDSFLKFVQTSQLPQ